MYRFLVFISVFVALTKAGNAQIFNQFFPKFYEGGKEKTFGAIGGIRTPQFSNINLNNDGLEDLFVFDKTGSKVLCFIARQGEDEIEYEYAPNYESSFPKLQNWALLHDFNKDGVQDIFCLPLIPIGTAGIQVFKGSMKNGKLSYELMRLPFQNSMAIPLFNGTKTNLYNSITDVPAIIDVDKDGDTDVLTFDPEGSRIVYYNNFSIERGFGLDTFIMEVADPCYGKVKESGFSSALYLSEDGIACATGNYQPAGSPRHSGSTVTAFDEACDGDMDIILGDISNNNIVFLKNTGTKDNPWITEQDLAYPPNTEAANIFYFNATFLVDVNNDKIKDLIVVPNDIDGLQNTNHIWLYINEGNNCFPKYKLKTKNFLLENTISIGAKSNVAVLDVNADGLKDLLVSGNGKTDDNREKANYLYYFKNVGSKKNPTFILEDANYLNLKNIIPNSISLVVSTGDLNSDGDIDILLTNSNGEMYYFENDGGPGSPVKYGNFFFPVIETIGQDGNAKIYDIDNDGVSDLITGESNYSLSFYKNYGQKGGMPAFTNTPLTEDFGHLFKIFPFLYDNTNNAPYFFKNYQGKEYALFGFNDGKVSLLERKKQNGTDSLKLINKNWGNIYAGEKSKPIVEDINDDGYYDIIMGNFRGGISFYATNLESRNITSANDEIESSLSLFPNPASNFLYIKGNQRQVEYSIYNALGNLMMKGTTDKIIDIINLVQGNYFIKLKEEGNINNTLVSSFIKM